MGNFNLYKKIQCILANLENQLVNRIAPNLHLLGDTLGEFGAGVL